MVGGNFPETAFKLDNVLDECLLHGRYSIIDASH